MSRVKQAQEFYASMQGQVITCVDNSYIPERAGVRLRLDKVGKSYADATVLTDPSGKLKTDGRFRCNIPTRAADVIAIDADTITFKIGHGGHVATYSRVTL